jgi:hypothetical protein
MDRALEPPQGTPVTTADDRRPNTSTAGSSWLEEIFDAGTQQQVQQERTHREENTTSVPAPIAAAALKPIMNDTSPAIASSDDSSTVIPFPHFLSHIPKTGAKYAWQTLNTLIRTGFVQRGTPKEDWFTICNVATAQLRRFDQWHGAYRGKRCAMYMSEQPYAERPENIYTITRDPHQQVLSQYFHCTESWSHAKHVHLMPNLTEWLEAWAKALTNQTLANENRQFRCYDPRNVQSHFLNIDPIKVDKQDLAGRYRVIGDQAEMPKSVCAIHISFTGLVQSACDCTPHRRRLDSLQYNPDKHAHGVANQGATFNTTAYQDKLIDAITEKDRLLYNLTRKVFAAQVQELELEHQIQLCDWFWQI